MEIFKNAPKFYHSEGQIDHWESHPKKCNKIESSFNEIFRGFRFGNKDRDDSTTPPKRIKAI